nr:alpha/beta hydrolase [uncultured Cohaesibacter sp.]
MNICIVTDIHDQPKHEQCILGKLETRPRVSRFALNDLCGRPDLCGEALHRYLFYDDGMDEVVRALKQTLSGDCIGIGYSAGGTALWRAAAAGLSFTAIFCISSTRLREEATIATPNQVFFGADDPGRPSAEWLSSVPDEFTILENAGHSYYQALTSEATNVTYEKIAKSIHC